MMNKIYLWFFLGLVPLFSNGQNFHPGIKAGMGGAFFRNTDIRHEFSFAYSMGAFVNYTINEDRKKGISVQAEFLFSQKGGYSYAPVTDVSPFYPISNKKLSYDLYYLEVPVLLKISDRERSSQIYNTWEQSSRLYAMAGLAPSFFLHGRSRYDIFNGADIRNGQSIDVGVILNAGVEYKTRLERLLFLEARVNHGLRNAFHGAPMRNFTYMILSGIRF